MIVTVGLEVMPFGQGYFSMAAPAAEFQPQVIAGKTEHGDHPLLRWMAANVTVETDAAGNLKPSKKRSTERIDGIVAGIMALGRTLLDHHPTSVYSTRGVFWIDRGGGG